MRVSKCTIALAMAGLLWGSRASAQQPANVRTSSPSGRVQTRPVGYEYYNYAPDETSPGDTPPAPAPEAAPAAESSPSACECKADDDCEEEEEEEEDKEPVRIFDQCCLLKKLNIQVGGWLAQSYTWNWDNPSDRFNGPVTWTDRSNEYQMNELYTYMKRDTNTEGCGWDIGGRCDTLYGTSYRWDTSAGWESTWNNNQFYGLAMPQCYGEVAYNDLKVKLGRFVSPVGFYTVGTYNNFFNTIPYTYQYGEPFTHTGALATYQMTDDFAASGGIVEGWDSSFNWNPAGTKLAAQNGSNVDNPYNRHAAYLGTATKTNLVKEGDSLAWVGIYGREPDSSFANRTPRYFQTMVYSMPLYSNLQYILQSDYGVQSNAITSTGQTAQWYGVNQYLYYTRSNIMAWGGNFEWFRDNDGFRVGQVLPSFGSPNARGFARGPFEGNFYVITFGPRITPNKNVIIRPNLRCDWYNRDGGGSAPGAALPFNDGRSNNQQILGTDVVISY